MIEEKEVLNNKINTVAKGDSLSIINKIKEKTFEK